MLNLLGLTANGADAPLRVKEYLVLLPGNSVVPKEVTVNAAVSVFRMVVARVFAAGIARFEGAKIGRVAPLVTFGAKSSRLSEHRNHLFVAGPRMLVALLGLRFSPTNYTKWVAS